MRRGRVAAKSRSPSTISPIFRVSSWPFRAARESCSRPRRRHSPAALAPRGRPRSRQHPRLSRLFARRPEPLKKPKPDDPKDDLEWEDPAAPRDWPEARVTVDQRLAELVSLSAAPGRVRDIRRDAVPADAVAFQTAFSGRRGACRPSCSRKGATPTSADEADARTHALWTAELDPESRAQLRAIWSPDFRPEAFLPHEKGRNRWFFPRKKSRSNRAPLKGPLPPGRSASNMSSNDDAPASAGSPLPHLSLDAFDRHEAGGVQFGGHGLPVIGRVSLDKLAHRRSISASRRRASRCRCAANRKKQMLEAVANRWLEYNDVYVPRPLDPINLELALFPLAAISPSTLRSNPPPRCSIWSEVAFDALSIERWRHNIVLGRDTGAEVVTKGYLMPLGSGHRLVKSAQRRIQGRGGPSDGPVRVLGPACLIRISKPEKEYPAFRQSDDGRRVPFKSPHPDVPSRRTSGSLRSFGRAGWYGVWSTGLIDLTPRPKDAPPDPQQGQLSGAAVLAAHGPPVRAPR